MTITTTSTTHRTFTALALCLPLLALSACKDGQGEEDSDSESESDSAETGEVGDDYGVDLDGCPGATLIGILDEGETDCELGGTVPEGWFSELLFADGPKPEPNVPGELARFCKFKRDFDSGGATREKYLTMLDAIDASPLMSVDTVALNCAVQQAQVGLSESPEIQAAAREAFRANIGRVTAEQLAASADARTSVRLTLLDTVDDDNDPSEVINEHGLQMWEIAADIVCPDGDADCLEGIQQMLAMPRETPDGPPQWSNGGRYGAQTDVGLGIYAAVKDWAKDSDKPDGSPRLVLNLSLGWETSSIDSLDPERGPVVAVRTALQFAACNGALMFAAAGNNRVPECPANHTGMLYPGAFETLSAPTAAECEALGFSPNEDPDYPIFDGDRPLLIAVGGVDEFDAPLINSRDEGQPALVALGANGIASSLAGSSAALTGTSVSTIVASSTASLVWSYRPDLSPGELSSLIYDEGWATGDAASAGRYAGDAVHRLSVCASLDAGCEGQPDDQCPALDCPASAPAADGNLGDYLALIEQTLTDEEAGEKVDEFTLEGEGEAPSCDEDLADILAEPQPEVPVCPHCNVNVPPGTGTSKLNLSVSPEYVGVIEGVTFIGYDAARTPTTHVLTQAIVDSLNDPTSSITTVGLSAPGTVTATLIFALDDPTGPATQSNPITVNQI